MDQNCKIKLHFIWVKIQDFAGFFKHCFSYWRLPLVKVSARWNNIWGSKNPKNSKKGPFHGCWINTKKTWTFLISQSHMLYWWNLPHIYLNNVFQLAKSWGVSHRLYKGVNKKTLKMRKKKNFLAQFRPFLNTSKNCSISDESPCFPSLVKNAAFGEFWWKKSPKSSLNW